MRLDDYFDFLAPDDIRLKGSRIGIESVLYEYIHRSRTPEQIAAHFDTLTLEQVYATILYYLHNRPAIDAYLNCLARAWAADASSPGPRSSLSGIPGAIAPGEGSPLGSGITVTSRSQPGMTLRYLADEHLPHDLVAAIRQRDPNLVIWRIGQAGAPTSGTPDPAVLVWCEAHNFVLVTNNRRSMPRHLEEHLRAGRHMPGIFVLNPGMNWGEVIDILLGAALASLEDEHRDQIKYLQSLYLRELCRAIRLPRAYLLRSPRSVGWQEWRWGRNLCVI